MWRTLRTSRHILYQWRGRKLRSISKFGGPSCLSLGFIRGRWLVLVLLLPCPSLTKVRTSKHVHSSQFGWWKMRGNREGWMCIGRLGVSVEELTRKGQITFVSRRCRSTGKVVKLTFSYFFGKRRRKSRTNSRGRRACDPVLKLQLI